MTAPRLLDGDILLNSGSVAISDDCCCEQEPDCPTSQYCVDNCEVSYDVLIDGDSDCGWTNETVTISRTTTCYWSGTKYYGNNLINVYLSCINNKWDITISSGAWNPPGWPYCYGNGTKDAYAESCPTGQYTTGGGWTATVS